MNQSEHINELATALAKMQQQTGAIGKNKTAKIAMKTGGSFSFSYADLAAIIDATRQSMAQNGLSFTQTFVDNGHSYHMVSMLMHSSGQWIKSVLPINVSAVDIKQLGAQITYYRRYALTALLGICADDDNEEALEGNAACKSDTKHVTPKNQPASAEKIPPITKEEIHEIEEMFAKCDDVYVTNVTNHYAKQGIYEWNQLTREQYQSLYGNLNKKIMGKIA